MKISEGAKALLKIIPRVCWMTERNLARLMGVRAEKIKFYKAELEEAGLIQVIPQANGNRRNPRHEIIKLSSFGSPICKHILKGYCFNEWSWLDRNALIECYLKTGLEIVPFQARAKKPIERFCALHWKRMTEAQKMDFFYDHPTLNVGLVVCSHMMVVDIDSKENSWIEHKSFETTLTVSTSRGYHFYFRRDPAIETSTKIMPDIDTRCRASYVVLPPSIHPSKEPYRWHFLNKPNRLPALFRKEWLQNESSRRQSPRTAFALSQVILKGTRNEILWRFGRSMKSKGKSIYEIESTLVEINERKCQPPLSMQEMEALIANIWNRPNRSDFLE